MRRDPKTKAHQPNMCIGKYSQMGYPAVKGQTATSSFLELTQPALQAYIFYNATRDSCTGLPKTVYLKNPEPDLFSKSLVPPTRKKRCFSNAENDMGPTAGQSARIPRAAA